MTRDQVLVTDQASHGVCKHHMKMKEEKYQFAQRLQRKLLENSYQPLLDHYAPGVTFLGVETKRNDKYPRAICH